MGGNTIKIWLQFLICSFKCIVLWFNITKYIYIKKNCSVGLKRFISYYPMMTSLTFLGKLLCWEFFFCVLYFFMWIYRKLTKYTIHSIFEVMLGYIFNFLWFSMTEVNFTAKTFFSKEIVQWIEPSSKLYKASNEWTRWHMDLVQ